MQKTKSIIAETIVTLLHDNLSNLIILAIAMSAYKIPLTTSLKLWLIGQSLNITFSYSRRYLFSKYDHLF